MKKRIGLSLLAMLCVIVLPLKASAASGEIFGSTSQTMASGTTTENGNTVTIQNRGENTKIYLGANVTSGTLTEYNAHLELSNSNFTFSSFTRESGWTGTIAPSTDGKGIDINLKSTTGITGRGLVATITLKVSDSAPSTETCTMTLQTAEAETPVTPETPKCKVENGKYYDANGNEVSQEAYNASCTTAENPQTGNFLPYTIIIAGILVAVGLYFITKKNNKIYHV